MNTALIFVFFYFSCVHCKIWQKGIVHYNINSKDYELMTDAKEKFSSGARGPEDVVLGVPATWTDDLVRLAGSRWMYVAQSRAEWKSMGEAYVQQWTSWLKYIQDLHSQDLIMATFGRMEREICVKFFNTPTNYSANVDSKILFISNPEKQKDCPTRDYDFSKSVVDMVIGYKCLNDKDIARIVVEMLKATVTPPDPANKFDLVKKYQSMVAGAKPDTTSTTLLSPADRNFINAYYHTECSNLDTPAAPPLPARRADGYSEAKSSLTDANWNYYKNLLWPLGIVMYSVDPSLRGLKTSDIRVGDEPQNLHQSGLAPTVGTLWALNDLHSTGDTPEYALLRLAMTHIEMETCIMFVDEYNQDVLVPRNLIWFAKEGADEPALGMIKGNQSVDLFKMTHGWPGHTAHVMNNLMRTLGVPMMSNRYDRDHYIFINWGLVEKGKEYLLERSPEDAWIESVAYDFFSVTHAPANYLCSHCLTGAQTVQPQQDHLWQRTLTMGHGERLTASDKKTVELIYSKECASRWAGRSNAE